MRWIGAAALAIGCGGITGDAVTFGAAGPWSEGYGMMNQRGITLAVEQINARGGIEGRPLEVVMKDDQGDGTAAAAIAEEFVANPSITAVVGHVNSGAMVAAAKVYDGHLPAVATTATSPDLTGMSPWVFRVISSDSANGIDLARFAASLGHRRAAILYENNSYGRGLASAFRSAFRGTVTGMDPIADDDTDFEPYVSYFVREQPDIVFVAGTENSGMAFLREATRQGLDADFLGGDGWSGIVAAPEAAEGAFVGTPFIHTDPRPEARRFVKAFRDRFRMDPDGNAALAYDATMLLAEAVAKRGTDREAVRDYLTGLEESAGFAGVTGTIRFLPTGDPVGKSFVMARVHDGGLVPATQP
ncbi:MAG: ABC transporter substrate-binding protein [Gemmatimonadaceae bacterium]